jgi:NTE family protein
VRPDLSGVGSANFAARQRSIEAGRQAMRQALPKLKAALQMP